MKVSDIIPYNNVESFLMKVENGEISLTQLHEARVRMLKPDVDGYQAARFEMLKVQAKVYQQLSPRDVLYDVRPQDLSDYVTNGECIAIGFLTAGDLEKEVLTQEELLAFQKTHDEDIVAQMTVKVIGDDQNINHIRSKVAFTPLFNSFNINEEFGYRVGYAWVLASKVDLNKI